MLENYSPIIAETILSSFVAIIINVIFFEGGIMRIAFLEIHREGSKCHGKFWFDQDKNKNELGRLDIGPEKTVKIPDSTHPYTENDYCMKDLVTALIEFDEDKLAVVFEERGQFEIGRFLYSNTLGKLGNGQITDELDLRIITDDEFIGQLPWPLLSQDGIFLVNKGWAISMIACTELRDIELAPSPIIVVVAPEPNSLARTDRDQHLNQLQQVLRKHNPKMVSPQNLILVYTWEEFEMAIEGNVIDVVYYYGHGEGNQNRSRLLFESTENDQVLNIAAGELATCFRGAKRLPSLVYINCCHGDAGGFIGVGRKLGAFIPCVVTNRTAATVKAATVQALMFWEHVLIQGVKPHIAVASNYQFLGANTGLNQTKLHWFTPVIYASYKQWKSYPPKRVKTHIYDSNWRAKLDRVTQFGQLSFKVREMVEHDKPQVIAFIWYGMEGQGMQHFHDRLEVNLQHQVGEEAVVVSYRPSWPASFKDVNTREFSGRAIEETLLDTFKVDSLDRINARIRADASGAKKVVVVLNHPHICNPVIMDPKLLMNYLEWWDQYGIDRIKGDPHYFVLGCSFQIKKSNEFRKGLDKLGYSPLTFRRLAIDVLPELMKLKPEDINDFVSRHNIFIPESRKKDFFDYIIGKTDGRYDPSLIELERLVVAGYEEVLEKEINEMNDVVSDAEGTWGM